MLFLGAMFNFSIPPLTNENGKYRFRLRFGTVLVTTCDRRRFSRASLKQSATSTRLPPFLELAAKHRPLADEGEPERAAQHGKQILGRFRSRERGLGPAPRRAW